MRLNCISVGRQFVKFAIDAMAQSLSMTANRFFLFGAAVLLGFAVWNVQIHPTVSYNATSEWSAEKGIHLDSCPSIWDRWTDNLPPTPYQPSQSQIDLYGPTLYMIQHSACDASIVGHEHLSEVWLGGAAVAFGFSFVKWRKL